MKTFFGFRHSAGRGLLHLGLSLLVMLGTQTALGQAFPIKPMKLIVPYPAGGSSDAMARLVGAEMAKTLGQQLLVENVAGAAGAIGVNLVAKSAPDGYTMILSNFGPMSHLVILDPKLPYHPIRDFAAVGQIYDAEYVLVSRPGFEANSVAQLVALARSAPGRVTYASAGSGGGTHLGFEYFGSAAKIDLLHIPFKGEQPGITDLIADRVDLGMFSALTAMPMIKAGKMKAIAATGSRRLRALPDLPTVSEAGLAGFEFSVFGGIHVPASTPAPIIEKLSAALIAAVKEPVVQERMNSQGMTPIGSRPEVYAGFLVREIDKWAAIIKQTSIKRE